MKSSCLKPGIGKGLFLLVIVPADGTRQAHVMGGGGDKYVYVSRSLSIKLERALVHVVPSKHRQVAPAPAAPAAG